MIRLLKNLCLAVIFAAAPSVSFAQDWAHGISQWDKPKYPAGFGHFDYVNPNAPKGGRAVQAAVGSFDSFNAFITRGEQAPGITLIYETLFKPSLDEADISAKYGLIAEAMKYPDDYASVSFRLNPKAKWHDGAPITVDDVIWSYQRQIETNPQTKAYYQNVKSAEKSGENEVTFTFDMTGNRELPLIMSELTVLPRHWWEGKDAAGKLRNIAESTLEAPLGSGPYKIGAFEAGRFVTYERVKDAWANDLNVNVGQNNFDELKYDLYRDETVMIEAIKSGAYDYRQERVSKIWATGYENLPARDKGFLKLEEFPRKSSGIMQAFVLNSRRDKLKDQRVREALDLAFDFETTNRSVFYGIYERANSFFSGTALAALGLPSAEELALLEPLRGKVPDSVFSASYANPVGGDADKMRANYRKALGLFKEAGWTLKGTSLVNEKTGEPFTLEFVGSSPIDERYVLPFQTSLAKVGVRLDFRQIDTSAYQERVRNFDFDMITHGWAQTLSPGNEQRNYWGSKSAAIAGSRNLAGISDPAIDALIDKVIFSPDRAALKTATHALDRVLLSHHFVIPQWFSKFNRYVYWDRFGHPEKLPEFDFGFPQVWWFDQAKASRIK